MIPKGGGSPPLGRDIFCLKIFDTFSKSYVHESKMNAASRAQLTFRMLSIQTKISLLGLKLIHFSKSGPNGLLQYVDRFIMS